jgi:hypothetical protein
MIRVIVLLYRPESDQTVNRCSYATTPWKLSFTQILKRMQSKGRRKACNALKQFKLNGTHASYEITGSLRLHVPVAFDLTHFVMASHLMYPAL